MGQEFKSKMVQRIFKSAGIQHFYAYNKVMESFSERTIKTKYTGTLPTNNPTGT
jgi:hypothetical protein